MYEVLLDRMSPESLRARFPEMTIQVAGAQTVLRPRPSGSAHFDALLEHVSSLGLQLDEVHRLSTDSDEDVRYEIRVAGEIRPEMLGHLSGSDVIRPCRPRVRIVAMATGLYQFLRSCTECGARIQRVRLVDAACD